jgi:hypothetical protein
MPFPYSYDTFTPTTSTTDFSYAGIELLTDVPVKDQIKVYKNGQLVPYGAGASGWTVIAGDSIRLGTAVSSGTIKLARETDIENKEVTFTNSSVLTAQDLNKNTDQLLFLCQELYDKAQNLSLVPAGGLADDSITSDKLSKTTGAEAVVTSAIRDLAVQTAKIDDNAVTTAKIDDDAVTEDQIIDGAVVPAKLSTGGPSWTTGGAVTVTDDLSVGGDLTVTGDIVGGAASRPVIVSTVATTNAEYSTASPHNRSDAVELSLLSTSITTKRANSQVLVRFVVNYDSNNQHGAFILFRDSTEIGSNTTASPSNRSYGIAPISYGNNDNIPVQTVIEYLDTVSTAGAYTYKLKAYNNGNALTIYLNKTRQDGDTADHEFMSSTCILQEVFTQ